MGRVIPPKRGKEDWRGGRFDTRRPWKDTESSAERRAQRGKEMTRERLGAEAALQGR